MIYMDHSATSPVDPEVFKAMKPYFTESFGNTSTLYKLGRDGKMAMESARKQVASLINAEPGDHFYKWGNRIRQHGN